MFYRTGFLFVLFLISNFPTTMVSLLLITEYNCLRALADHRLVSFQCRCLSDRESTMDLLTVQSQTMLMVLVMSVLVCEGTITGPAGCTTTCCMSCHLGDNCQICYKLNPPSINCPCLDSLNKDQLKRLIQLRDARSETRTETKTETRTDGRTRTRTEMKTEGRTGSRTETRTDGRTGMMTMARTEKVREGGSCHPVCCPSVRCSESSCPQCYRRHRQSSQKCPCRTW